MLTVELKEGHSTSAEEDSAPTENTPAVTESVTAVTENAALAAGTGEATTTNTAADSVSHDAKQSVPPAAVEERRGAVSENIETEIELKTTADISQNKLVVNASRDRNESTASDGLEHVSAQELLKKRNAVLEDGMSRLLD